MAFDRSQGEVELDLDQVQGDVLVGLQKDFQWFIGFTIADVAKFKIFLKNLTPHLTTARTVLEREFLIQAQHTAKKHDRLNFIGTNIGFTITGLQALGVADLSQISDTSFKNGLAQQSAGLGDPASGAGAPSQWVVGGTNQVLHGLLLITGPSKDSVDHARTVISDLAGTSWTVVYDELGLTRAQDRGHEHFGFLDGVSQPSVRGQIDQFFPHRKFLTPAQNPDDPGQGLPGSDLLWPGAFVFGYPSQQSADMDNPGPAVDGGLGWMKNGTFMVFRRLKQLVPEFDAFVAASAATLNMDADLLAARMVGRWKSGAPMVTTPLQDDPTLAEDDLLVNDFEFSQDAAGRRCPYAAHIRKSYPRNDITPAGTAKTNDFDRRAASEANTQTRRIMRRGIPFGGDVGDDEAEQEKTLIDRGLMFVCYQSSIAGQFEFILQAWVNNPGFPPASGGKAGFDPILGQAGADPLLGRPGTDNRARNFGGAVVNYPTGPTGDPITLASDFIVPTGGGYFLVPSIDAVETVLAA
ncbi:MAG TPA: Dyp-type peroxidase [Stellaceae bacterium]|nr:Dyp-type peroxidase [Stellaceae bacterium]